MANIGKVSAEQAPKTLKMATLMGWLGSLLAITGSLLLAAKVDVSAWGWVLFTISSGILVAWGIKEKQHHQTVMQMFFLCANLMGVYNYLLAV